MIKPPQSRIAEALHHLIAVTGVIVINARVDGPDSAGFYLARFETATIATTGLSRSPDAALAYALEEAADRLLGKRPDAPSVRPK